MKKRLAEWLRKLADRLYQEKEVEAPKEPKCKPIKLGNSYKISTEEIKEYAVARNIQRFKDAKVAYINSVKSHITKSIYAGIKKRNLIKYEVSDSIVTGYIRLYEESNQ